MPLAEDGQMSGRNV